jgi:hypothetical protein
MGPVGLGWGPILFRLRLRYPASSSVCLLGLGMASHWLHVPPVRMVPCVEQVMTGLGRGRRPWG